MWRAGQLDWSEQEGERYGEIDERRGDPQGSRPPRGAKLESEDSAAATGASTADGLEQMS